VVRSDPEKQDGKFQINVKATDGELKCECIISSDELASRSSSSVSSLDYDFTTLVYQVFSNDLPERFHKSIELIGTQQGDGEVTLHINLIIGGNIKNELIYFKLKDSTEDEDADERFDLFEWTRILKTDRDDYKFKYEKLNENQAQLSSDLEKSLKAQEELVQEMRTKQKRQFEVFTKVINDFQSYNNKIWSGEISEKDDMFNLDKIRSLISDARDDQAVTSPKKRKLVKEKKSGVAKPKKETSQKAKVKKEKDIPVESETQSLPDPIKSEFTESVHFKFQNDEPQETKLKEEKATEQSIPDSLAPSAEPSKGSQNDNSDNTDADNDDDDKKEAKGNEDDSTEDHDDTEADTDADTEEETVSEQLSDDEDEVFSD
jgi:hypothetical protein